MSNREVYQSPYIVDVYLKKNFLLGPEQVILDLFRDQWENWRVLDIGIGAGRTTAYFAPIVAEYVGVDYAESMIRTCQSIFDGRLSNVKFQLGDARSMPEFESGYFDFVMFSFNGLDSISHEERRQALAEMKRVGKKGGFLFFSSHNLQFIPKMYRLGPAETPRQFAYRCYRLLMLLYHNGLPGYYKHLDHAVIRDDVHRFRLRHYYVKPATAVAQLRELGFRNIRVFPSKSGNELDIAKLDSVYEYGWLHYLCNM